MFVAYIYENIINTEVEATLGWFFGHREYVENPEYSHACSFFEWCNH